MYMCKSKRTASQHFENSKVSQLNFIFVFVKWVYQIVFKDNERQAILFQQ